MSTWFVPALCYGLAVIVPYMAMRYLHNPGMPHRFPGLRFGAAVFLCFVPIWIAYASTSMINPMPTEDATVVLLLKVGLLMWASVILGWVISCEVASKRRRKRLEKVGQ